MKSLILLILITLSGMRNVAVSQSVAHAHPAIQHLKSQLDSIENHHLADFAPNLYEKILPLLQSLDKENMNELVTNKKKLKKYTGPISAFVTVGSTIRSAMLSNFKNRHTILRSDFIRKYEASQVQAAEDMYWIAIETGERRQYDSLKLLSAKLAMQYKNIFSYALSAKPISATGTQIEKYIKYLNQDLAKLQPPKLNSSDDGVEGLDGVMYRFVSPFQPSFGLNEFGLNYFGPPPYYPPGNNGGPRPPDAVTPHHVSYDSLDISFYDVSDNELGNRILRTDDRFTWTSIAEVGRIEEFDKFTFTDHAVMPDREYCYRVETYNDEGSNESQLRCVYTKDTTKVSIWRVQLRIKIADIENADLDAPITVRLESGESYKNVTTFLDYSIDDFERMSNFTYDLGFDGLEKLSDIISMSISNGSSDHCFIEAIELKVDGERIFRRRFGSTEASVLDLVRWSPYLVSHEELRNSPGYINLFDEDTPLPPFEIVDDGRAQVVLAKEELRSIVESISGNLLHTDADMLDHHILWRDEGSTSSVVLTPLDDTSMHVQLRLESLIDYWFDPNVDVGFDISFSKKCQDGKVKVEIKSSNFTTNIQYDLWEQLNTSGALTVAGKIINYFAHKDFTPPVIEESLELPLNEDYQCEDLSIFLKEDGTLAICCGTF